MLVNAKQHFPAHSAAFRRPLHSLLKLIIKNNVLCFDLTPYIFRGRVRTSGPFCPIQIGPEVQTTRSKNRGGIPKTKNIIFYN
jgi:hypothetical protein